MINLVLKAMTPLCESREGVQLFSQLFKLIESQPKPKGQTTAEEEEMQENIMWLVNSMVDQAETGSVVKVCLENRIVKIIAD